MRLPDKYKYTLTFLLSLSLVIYLTFITFSNVGVTPFIILGLFSILAITLPDRYQNITILLIYLPAAYSLYELVMNGNFEILIDLTTGYILSLSFLFAYGYYKSTTPASLYANYLATCITTLLALDAALNSDKTALSIFYNYVFRVVKRAALSSELIGEITPQLSSPLAAVSVLAFIYHLNLKFPSTDAKLRYNTVVMSVIWSVGMVGVIVLYSLFFVDSIALSLIFIAISLIAISIFTRVKE